jgi:hypothetical protein
LPVFSIVFSAAFAAAYLAAAELNCALFTYHPVLGEFDLGTVKPRSGPAMYWYGWTATAGVVAGVAGAIAGWLPEPLARRLGAAWAWAVPLAAMIAFPWFLREFLLK